MKRYWFYTGINAKLDIIEGVVEFVEQKEENFFIGKFIKAFINQKPVDCASWQLGYYKENDEANGYSVKPLSEPGQILKSIL